MLKFHCIISFAIICYHQLRSDTHPFNLGKKGTYSLRQNFISHLLLLGTKNDLKGRKKEGTKTQLRFSTYYKNSRKTLFLVFEHLLLVAVLLLLDLLWELRWWRPLARRIHDWHSRARHWTRAVAWRTHGWALRSHPVCWGHPWSLCAKKRERSEVCQPADNSSGCRDTPSRNGIRALLYTLLQGVEPRLRGAILKWPELLSYYPQPLYAC